MPADAVRGMTGFGRAAAPGADWLSHEPLRLVGNEAVHARGCGGQRRRSHQAPKPWAAVRRHRNLVCSSAVGRAAPSPQLSHRTAAQRILPSQQSRPNACRLAPASVACWALAALAPAFPGHDDNGAIADVRAILLAAARTHAVQPPGQSCARQRAGGSSEVMRRNGSTARKNQRCSRFSPSAHAGRAHRLANGVRAASFRQGARQTASTDA